MNQEFSIIRILGNELYPRDKKNSRVSALLYILNNEKAFDKTEKIWIINRVIDNKLLSEYVNILDDYNQKYYFLGFDTYKYYKAKSIDEKIIAAIGLNEARNYAIALGKEIAKYTIPADGDCYFPERAWAAIRTAIRNNKNTKYFSIPMYRIDYKSIDPNTIDTNFHPKDEPQLVFRDDTIMKFDLNFPFSKRSKAELLIRLGHERVRVKETACFLPKSEICKTAGYVIHLSTGNTNIENNLVLRGIARRRSIYYIFWKIEQKKEAKNIKCKIRKAAITCKAFLTYAIPSRANETAMKQKAFDF